MPGDRRRSLSSRPRGARGCVNRTPSCRHDVSAPRGCEGARKSISKRTWHSFCCVDGARLEQAGRAMNQSRGFVSRRRGANVTLPPGQYLTRDCPVLSATPTPQVSLDRWELTIDDGTNVLRHWSWKPFRELPSEPITVDIHCVTRWSKLGTAWEGVSLDTLDSRCCEILRSHGRSRRWPRKPGRHHSLQSLAACAALSRSTFVQRFTDPGGPPADDCSSRPAHAAGNSSTRVGHAHTGSDRRSCGVRQP